MPDAAADGAALWPLVDGLPLAGGHPGADDAATDARPRTPVDDPATGETVGFVAHASAADVEAAVARADAAWPAWRDLGDAERMRVLRAAADRVEARAGELIDTLVREVGKPVHDARGDVLGGVRLVRAFADLVPRAHAMRELTGEPGAGAADRVLVHRVPVGPMAVITPWNSPVYLTLNCVAPALAAGCAVVVKPAEAAPLAVTAALRLIAAELPPGVLGVVNGPGTEVGAALVAHPRIRGVSFVGGTRAGRAVLAAAAPTITRTALELGGNDPALVLDDAPLDNATLRELVAGCYGMSGQVCFNIKRIYVHRSRYDAFVERFTAMVDRLVVGPGSAPGVHLGPLTTPGGFANARRLLDAARASGATVHEGGVVSPHAELDHGRYVRPTVVTNIARDHELVLDEQFAPIVPIVRVEDDDDAVAEANRTEYGLCSSIWSADLGRATALAARIEAGNTFVNAHRVGASVPLVPFGGVKQSGLGRNHLMHAIAECTEEHAIVAFERPHEQIAGIDAWLDLTAEPMRDTGATTPGAHA